MEFRNEHDTTNGLVADVTRGSGRRLRLVTYMTRHGKVYDVADKSTETSRVCRGLVA